MSRLPQTLPVPDFLKCVEIVRAGTMQERKAELHESAWWIAGYAGKQVFGDPDSEGFAAEPVPNDAIMLVHAINSLDGFATPALSAIDWKAVLAAAERIFSILKMFL